MAPQFVPTFKIASHTTYIFEGEGWRDRLIAEWNDRIDALGEVIKEIRQQG